GLADPLVAEVRRVGAVRVGRTVRVADAVDAGVVRRARRVEHAGPRRIRVRVAEAVLATVAGAAVRVGGARRVTQADAAEVEPAHAAAAFAAVGAGAGRRGRRGLAHAVAAGLARRAVGVRGAGGRRQRRHAHVPRRVAGEVAGQDLAVLIGLARH